jgi:hypothetical protein
MSSAAAIVPVTGSDRSSRAAWVIRPVDLCHEGIPVRSAVQPIDDENRRPERRIAFHTPGKRVTRAHVRPARLWSYHASTGKLAQERVGRAVAGHADAGVHGDDAVRAGDDRVQVQFGDLRQVIGKPRDAEQDVTQTVVGG